MEGWPRMTADWKIKKLPIRVYEKWRSPWTGVLDVTKKHNQANKVYRSKYK